MAKDPAFLFYPGDYLRDTQCFSEKTQVAYDRIICEHMRNIHITKQQLIFFTKRLSEEEKEELMNSLMKVDGGYCIEWVALSIEKRRAYSQSRRENREGKTQEHMLTHVNHMENEIENEDVSDNKSESINEKMPFNFCLDVIRYLNKKVSSNFKPSTKETVKHIRARWNDGYKFEHFKKVIDIKHDKWHNDSKMVDFLRPQTLFGTKFESYLNEKPSVDDIDNRMEKIDAFIEKQKENKDEI